jgi:anti-sigma factor RsiW
MIEPKVIDLMNLAIDGVASPRERAELEKALAADPTTRSYYESLARVVEKLNHDPMPEPPAELEPRILLVQAAPVVDVRSGTGGGCSDFRRHPAGTSGHVERAYC